MKKAILFIFLLLGISIALNYEYVLSGTTEISGLVGVGMHPEQAAQIDKLYSTAITASQLPNTTDAIDLGSATKTWRYLYSEGLNSPTAYEEAVAGAGTTVTDAAALSAVKHIHQLTGADGTKGWKFATGIVVGQIEILLNTTAGVPKIYGESGSTCNGGSADAACTLVTGIVAHICYKTASLTYICS